MDMEEGLRTEWLKALRSGDYKQCRGSLRSTTFESAETSYCCLGVLAKIAGLKFAEGDSNLLEGDSYPSDSYRHKISPLLGDKDTCEYYALTARNDGSKDRNGVIHTPHSFKEIADWIEANIGIREKVAEPA